MRRRSVRVVAGSRPPAAGAVSADAAVVSVLGEAVRRAVGLRKPSEITVPRPSQECQGWGLRVQGLWCRV